MSRSGKILQGARMFWERRRSTKDWVATDVAKPRTDLFWADFFHARSVCSGLGILLLFALLPACGQQFKLSGRIDVEILAKPPHQNYPQGTCVIPFAVVRASNSWHMQFQVPTNYSGSEDLVDFYGSGNGEMYAVREVCHPTDPRKVFHTAGVVENGDPAFMYSSCAPFFLVWLSYLRDRDSFESIPRLFYDHRANFTGSSPSCSGKIQARTGSIIREMQFKELGDGSERTDSYASYRTTEVTNINGQEIVAAFELDAYIRIPIVIEEKLLLENSWTDIGSADSIDNEVKVVLGARYRARLDKVVFSGQSITLPPLLNPGASYQIVDSRFGEGFRLSNSVIYVTNRWLPRDEAFQLYKRRQAVLRQQAVVGDSSMSVGRTPRPIILALLCLPTFAIFWLMYAAKKRGKQTRTKKQ